MQHDSTDSKIEPTATCSAKPSAPATVRVKTNIQLTGRHEFTIKNPGNAPINVVIEIVLEDSEGHRVVDSKPMTIPARSEDSGTMDSLLTTSYDKTGNVLVTARIKIDGAAFCSSSSGQNMKVV